MAARNTGLLSPPDPSTQAGGRRPPTSANGAPRHCADLHGAWQKRDFETVERINDRLMPLHEALFVESSPGPVKYAASQLGLCDNRLRLPMIQVTAETENKVRDAMTHAGLIN